MKKILTAVLLLISITTIVKSQDLIVTLKGDSINCKITRIKNDFIYFTFKYETEIRNSLLQIADIKTYIYNYYKIPEVPSAQLKGRYDNYQKFRIGLYGGWSTLTAKIDGNIPPDFESYYKELKTGIHFSGDLSYFTSDRFGFGMRYSRFNTKNELNNIYVTYANGQTRTGKLSDNITNQFIGPLICSRSGSSKNKTRFIADFGLGYLGYNNDAVLIDNFNIKGNTLGVFLDLGADIPLDNNFSLALMAAFTGGSLSKYEISDGYTTQTVTLLDNNRESISRIDLSIGLRWNK